MNTRIYEYFLLWSIHEYNRYAQIPKHVRRALYGYNSGVYTRIVVVLLSRVLSRLVQFVD